MRYDRWHSTPRGFDDARLGGEKRYPVTNSDAKVLQEPWMMRWRFMHHSPVAEDTCCPESVRSACDRHVNQMPETSHPHIKPEVCECCSQASCMHVSEGNNGEADEADIQCWLTNFNEAKAKTQQALHCLCILVKSCCKTCSSQPLYQRINVL